MNHRKLDILFISEHPTWPLDQGFRVHGYNMMVALEQKKVRVGFASIEPVPSDAPNDLKQLAVDWPLYDAANLEKFLAAWRGPAFQARMRLARYQGRDLNQFSGIISLVQRHQPRVVIGLGQHSPMMLTALRHNKKLLRIWYAADELVYFQLSCMSKEPLKRWPFRLQNLALYAALETLFARGLDGAIGVSPVDTRLLKTIAGVKHSVTVRNGVDVQYFYPRETVAGPTTTITKATNRSLVFWGRLDFEPNIDAICWFANNVWPAIYKKHADATLKIMGKNAIGKVKQLQQIQGIEFVGPVDDLRPHVHQASATILPMRCGGGIKNKLLEAAAMGCPIIASPRAIAGLDFGCYQPLLIAKKTSQWVQALTDLWSNPTLATTLSEQSRQWSIAHHTWPYAATQLLDWLGSLQESTQGERQYFLAAYDDNHNDKYGKGNGNSKSPNHYAKNVA